MDNILAELPKATAKATVERALAVQLQPVADMANSLWPGADDTAFAVSRNLKRSQQRPEVSATTVTMFVGATRSAPHAHLLEWGTEPRFHESGKFVGAVAPAPMLAPAWEAHKEQVIRGLADALRAEIQATIARRAKRGL